MKNRRAKTLYGLLALLYLLHTDFWFWEDSRMIAGLPVGLLYHLLFCFAAMLLLLIITRARPARTDEDTQ